MESIACSNMFGGEQRRYKHKSEKLSCDMHFSIYLPPQVSEGRVPVLYWLSGLTGTDENFVIKAGAQRVASELGLAIVMGDTSPRGEDVPDDPEQAYDFGLGAGFYLNATQAPWNKHYKMYDYVTQELPVLINDNFPVDPSRQSIFGHSMGGHGALSIALKNPDQYKSVSAFAPIASPINCPWGCKAFKSYLGEDVSTWQEYDSAALIAKATTHLPMLVDQGTADEFLGNQLKCELLLEAAEKAGYPLRFIEREGYDHSYFFIASFIEEHLRFHEKILSA
jgi:S-formylglutathione hydrolase